MKSTNRNNGVLAKSRHHLDGVDESYGQHFLFAARFSLRLLGASAAVFIHACIPGLFENTGRQTVLALARQLEERKDISKK